MIFKLIIDETKPEEVVVTAHSRSALTDKLEALVLSESGADKVAAYLDEDLVLLPFSQIEYIMVLDSKTYAIDTKGQRYLLKQRLYELEAILPHNFIRINKSAIANEKRIERFTAAFSGAVDAVFKCGCKEYVSRRCFAAIKRRYEL